MLLKWVEHALTNIRSKIHSIRQIRCNTNRLLYLTGWRHQAHLHTRDSESNYACMCTVQITYITRVTTHDSPYRWMQSVGFVSRDAHNFVEKCSKLVSLASLKRLQARQLHRFQQVAQFTENNGRVSITASCAEQNLRNSIDIYIYIPYIQLVPNKLLETALTGLEDMRNVTQLSRPDIKWYCYQQQFSDRNSLKFKFVTVLEQVFHIT